MLIHNLNGKVRAYYPGESFPSKLSAFFSGKYSHIAVIYDNNLDFTSYLTGGVGFYPVPAERKFDIFKLTDEALADFDWQTAWSWALDPSTCKIGYDYKALIGTALAKDKINNPNRLRCDEVVIEFFKQGGIELDCVLSPTGIVNSNKLVKICGSPF